MMASHRALLPGFDHGETADAIRETVLGAISEIRRMLIAGNCSKRPLALHIGAKMVQAAASS